MDLKKDSWVISLDLPRPSLSNNIGDADRIIQALKNKIKTSYVDIDYDLLKEIPQLIRSYDYNILCTFFKYRDKCILIDIKNNSDLNHHIIGLAVDLGTTRIVMRLIDLTNGNKINELTFDNPQIQIGPDILQRIHYAEKNDGLKELNQLLIQEINNQITRLCSISSISNKDIYCIAIAGNTAMTHFLMGLDPHWIIREPYIPVINNFGLIKASKLGIIANPRSQVLIFPNIGSYFGGDLISGILYSNIYNSKETSILVDVGTNAEVVLGNKDWMIACAGAAGPALESGVSEIGITACPGAIEKIQFNSDINDFEFFTIDNQKPVGICGSGFIDLAAALFISGMIDIRGKFVPEKCNNRLKYIDEILHFIVVKNENSSISSDLSISQADLESLIRSKAAMYTILRTITNSVGISFSDLSNFYIAGTFGNYINPKSAITIGMIPDLPLDKYKPLGNSSLEGASLVLSSISKTQSIEKIRDSITYMELNVNQEFMNRFSAAKFIPHTDKNLFPTVFNNNRHY